MGGKVETGKQSGKQEGRAGLHAHYPTRFDFLTERMLI